jgi:hypothetical protein
MTSFYAHPDLTWRPITDIEPLRVALAWPDEASPLVTRFVGIVRQLSRSRR